MKAKRKGLTMTRKDYVTIAAALREMGERTENWQAVTLAVLALVPVFEADNSLFKPEVFFNACGLEWVSES
jgi:hypothetical protein